MTKIEEQYKRIREEQEKKRFRDEPLPIAAVLKDIDSGSLVIPEFQRNFVWDMDKIALLFDSIFKGYTIGNLLFWKTTEKLAHKKIGDKNAIPIEQIENKEYTYVLDGQQRLTSLYAVLRGKQVYKGSNKKPKLIKIFFDVKTGEFIKYTAKLEEFKDRTLEKIDKDGLLDRFRLIDLSQIFDEKSNFPNNLIDSERKKINGELINPEDINRFKEKNSELEKKKEILEKFAEILRTYTIPQFVDRDKNIDSVVTIFERINTQNVKLDIFDIMVAKTYENILFNDKKFTFNLNRARDKLLYNKELSEENLSPNKELSDDENLYYGIDDVTLLRMFSIFINKDNKIALQKKDIYDLRAQQIQDNIVPFRKILTYIHNYCKNQLNIDDVEEDYTNNNVLSFLTYVFSKKSYRDSNPKILNLWFWNSMLFNRFPGSQLQLIGRDVIAFGKGEDTFKRAINQRRNLLILNDENIISDIKLIDAGYNKVNSKLYQSCILLLNSLKPVDFDGKHEIKLADYIGSNTKNNKHHIIPYNSDAGKQLRKKFGSSKGEFIINNIANIAIISSDLNKEISKKSPKEYFKKNESATNFKEILKTHLIDENMYEDLKNERYEEFLIARTKKILDLIKEKCSIDNENLVFEIHNSSEEDENGN